ncbi:MAG: F0F1 ATP synthase subunit A [Candidatus Melainabacteria bacterium]|nr:F0F1 ATP synthase subunit A [Candidatus Melainabacteria bacterium]
MSHFWEATLAGQPVHLNTLLMAWSAMLVVLGLAWYLSRQLAVKPTQRQLVAEGVYNFCRSITMGTAGPRGDGYLFWVGSLFLFILAANLMGQLPLRLIPLPQGELMAATGDINTPAALALATLVSYWFLGIRKKGLRYFAHYFQPSPFFLPLNLLEDVTRPGSLMIRLFFNILVGEILSGIAIGIMPYVLPVCVIFLELFVAFVQAYIFTILSAVYIGLMTDDHH